MRRVKPSHPFFASPALVLVISVFMIFLQFMSFGSKSENFIYAVMMILQTVVFVIPSLFFCIMRGRGYVGKLDFVRLPRKSSIPVAIFGTLLLILSSCVLKFGIFHFAYDYSAYSLYGSSIYLVKGSFGTALLMTLSLAVFPAFTEEFVFRGIILYEYRMGGSVFAMIMSSLLFTFIHFDIKQFPIYFILGMILSWMVFLTRSVMISVISHMIYNIFVLFGEKYIWLFSSNPDSDILFGLILIVCLCVCLFFFLMFGERIMRDCAENGDEVRRAVPREKRKAMLFDVFTSLPLIGDFIIFLILGIIFAV